jgi:hypothetical protein
MQSISKEMRKLMADNRAWRRRFVVEIGYCMICLARGPELQLCVHEMTPGAFRLKAYPHREACLVACDRCNEYKMPAMPLPRQLAYKLLHDRWWFDLDVIRLIKNNGRDPIIVTMEEIRTAGDQVVSEQRELWNAMQRRRRALENKT